MKKFGQNKQRLLVLFSKPSGILFDMNPGRVFRERTLDRWPGVVARPGIEPGTQGFSVLCSTN